MIIIYNKYRYVQQEFLRQQCHIVRYYTANVEKYHNVKNNININNKQTD